MIKVGEIKLSSRVGNVKIYRLYVELPNPNIGRKIIGNKINPTENPHPFQTFLKVNSFPIFQIRS